MGRTADKPRIIRAGSGALMYRFTYRPAGAVRGIRVKIPAKTTNEREAQRRMSSAVADWVAKHPNGKAKPAPAPEGERGLAKVWGLFVDDTKTDPNRKSPPSDAWIHILEQHGRLFARSFPTVDDATALGIEQHRRNRLATGTRRTTLRHELFSLRLFLGWCERRGIIAAAPKIVLPARDDRPADCLSPEEVTAVLAEIPETVERGPTVGRPLRAFFQVAYYQGLRDRTVSLLTWDDYNKKTGELHIRAEIDKSKYERTIKVFAETRAILDTMRPNIVPRGTLIFGPAKRWSPIKKAAKRAGFEHLDISEHTLRHSRTTELCSRPDADPAAVAFLLGWRDVATLYARYFHPTKRHADRFVDAVDGVSVKAGSRK